MALNSSAYQLLVAQYRMVLGRMRAPSPPLSGGVRRRRPRSRVRAVLRVLVRLLRACRRVRAVGGAFIARGVCVFRDALAGAGEVPRALQFRAWIEPLQQRMLFAANPAVGIDDFGRFIAVWESSGQDGSGNGVYARRFDSAGAALGSDFLVNQTTVGNQDAPEIAVSGDGDFVITWTSDQSGSPDVFARVFSAAGTPLGGEILVNSTTAGAQQAPSVALRADGRFVITYEGAGAGDATGIYARAFNADGSPISASFAVNSTTSGVQDEPSLGMAPGGEFVIAWTDRGGSADRVRAQRFAASGAASGSEITVSSSGGEDQGHTSVALDAGGNFVIVWAEQNTDGDESGVYARRFFADGTPRDGNAVRINNTTNDDQFDPDVAMTAGGDYFVSWTSEDNGFDIFGRYIRSNGTPAANEFLVSSYDSGNQDSSSVAAGGNGQVAVIWEGEGSGGTNGIWGSRFPLSAPVNGAPVNVVPAAQTTPEDTPLIFSSAHGNAVSVADADAVNTDVRVVLTATGGMLTLSTTAGLSFTFGDGAADASMNFTGTPVEVNAALEGLRFDAPANSHGAGTLQIVTDDLGHTGSGGAKTDTASVAITIAAVADTPAVSNAITMEGMQSTGGLVITRNAADGAEVTHYKITGITGGTLFLSNGTTQVAEGAFITVAQGTAGLRFTPPSGSTATGQFNVQASTSNGDAGLGGGTATASITVLPAIAVVDTTSDVVDGVVTSIGSLLLNKGADGRISLREAVTAANNTAGLNDIQFNIPDSDLRHRYYRDDGIAGSLSLVATTTLPDASIADFDPDYPYAPFSWFSISLNAALAELSITSPLLLDGYTQPGASANTLSIGDDAHLRIELTASAASGNRGIAVQPGGAGSTITGLAVNGFNWSGIVLEPGADGNTIRGNFIGTDVTGTLARPNGDDGMQVRTSNNLIGGPLPAHRNLFSGNLSDGLGFFTFSGTASNNTVEGNYIGVDATGVVALGNSTGGVSAYNVANSTFRDNVISANTTYGIWFRTSTATGNTLHGNWIGTDQTAAIALGNAGDGILLDGQSNQNTIGGIGAGQGNVIANNAGDGVNVDDAIRAAIRGNSIFANTGLGIDLAGDGATANNGSTSAAQPNRGMDAPVITSAVLSLGNLAVAGYVGSSPGQVAFAGALVDLYAAAADPTGRGEGRIYLGTVTANGGGNFTGTIPAGAVVPGGPITAAATDANGNTSEFAVNFTAVLAPNQAPVNIVPGAQTTSEDSTLTLSAANGNLISIADADVAGDDIRVVLTVTGGRMTLESIDNITFSSGDGSFDAVMNFSGTLAAVNEALDVMWFDPNSNFHGTASLQIVTDDLGHTGAGGAMTDSDSVAITVTPEADTPSITPATTGEDTQSTSGLVISRNAADGAEVSHYKITSITGGSLFLNNGSTPVSGGAFITTAQGAAGLRFTPSLNSTATGHFNVQAATGSSNANLGGGTITANITVSPVNDTPTVPSPIADRVATEDAAFSFTFSSGTFADVDGDTLSYSATQSDGSALPAWLSFNAGARRFTGTPANADVGAADIRVTATDGSTSAFDTFTLTVNNTNDAPTLANALPDQAATEDSPFSFQFAANTFADIDAGDTLNYSATMADGSPLVSWLLFNAATRTFSGMPTNSDVGTANVRVTATDVSGATASDTFQVAVSNTNDPPAPGTPIADQVATEDSPFAYVVNPASFVDVDTGDALTWAAEMADGSPLPAWLAFDPATHTFSGIPGNGDVGTLGIRVRVTDTSGATATDVFTLSVLNANNPPTVASTIPDQAAAEETPFVFQFAGNTFNDVDAGDGLSYSAALGGRGAPARVAVVRSREPPLHGHAGQPATSARSRCG